MCRFKVDRLLNKAKRIKMTKNQYVDGGHYFANDDVEFDDGSDDEDGNKLCDSRTTVKQLMGSQAYFLPLDTHMIISYMTWLIC